MSITLFLVNLILMETALLLALAIIKSKVK
jgi:hypothetical protein